MAMGSRTIVCISLASAGLGSGYRGGAGGGEEQGRMIAMVDADGAVGFENDSELVPYMKPVIIEHDVWRAKQNDTGHPLFQNLLNFSSATTGVQGTRSNASTMSSVIEYGHTAVSEWRLDHQTLNGSGLPAGLVIGFACSVLWLLLLGMCFFSYSLSSELQSEDHEGTAESLKSNRAFVFIKPHAQTPAVQKLVRSKLQEAKINILSEGEIGAEDIDKNKLIDQHYYAIASKATLLAPEKLPVPADKFRDKFGENWSDVLAEGRAANAMQACQVFGISADLLETEWRKCEPAGMVIKFGGGFYCGKMIVKGKTLYVFNAFFMAMRSKFTQPGCSIYFFSVSWSPGDLPWAQFRGSVLGPTDPGAAPPESLRNMILQKWRDLGLKSAPNKGDNGVHASASPFEGLAEEMNWLRTPLSSHPFGMAISAEGVPESRIKDWSTDPQVRLQDGSKGSIFDALEDLDVKECYDKLVELNSIQ